MPTGSWCSLFQGNSIQDASSAGKPLKTYVNLGCGARFHPEWTNIDIVARGFGVIEHDLSTGIPLSDGYADVIYHAAVLEHLRKADALKFMKECHRVLKPKGVIRVGVPDFECMCRLYLEKLDCALLKKSGAADEYDWIMLEILDQMVRERGGGEMLDYLGLDPLPNENFVFQRIGHEGREIVAGMRTIRERLRKPPGLLRTVNRRIRAVRKKVYESFLDLLLGRNAAAALAIGRFRLGGEAHQWMYDRFSLGRLMLNAGFSAPAVRSASESAIRDWSRFQLDTHLDGTVTKPDLFFMEAVRA